METTVYNEKDERISQGCYIQRLFRNKVYKGIDGDLLNRKVLRGKRDKAGKRKNEVFYVDKTMDFRIEESLIKENVEKILEKLYEIEDTDVSGWNSASAYSYFKIKHDHYLKQGKKDVTDYIKFIGECIDERDCQTYENMKLRKNLREKNFKDIIEKIEVYETGIVCIFNNGFEIALQF